VTRSAATALAAALALTACDPRCGAFGRGDTRAQALGSLRLSAPARSVADARRLIEEERKTPGRHGCRIPPQKLPESLRWPASPPDPRDPLRPIWGCVEHDHLDLVTFRNPDGPSGFRIWSADAKRRHADEPTRYPEIFYYSYNDDFPESPDNIH
jgi:hypothetical protein